MCDPRNGRKVLKKEANNPQLRNPQEKFTVNERFTSKDIRVNLMPLKGKEE